MPRIEKSDFPPVARSYDLRIVLCNGVYRSPEPLQCLGTPATECLHRERNQASSRKSPSRIPAVLTLGSSSSGGAIRVCCSMEPGAPLRMRDHHVAIDERIGGRAAEPVVEPGLIQHKLPLRVRPSSGPRRLVHFSCADVPRRAADPREDVSQRVVSADDEATHAAGEGVKPVSVELLQTLPPCGSRSILRNSIAAPLVPAPTTVPPKTKRNTEPET